MLTLVFILIIVACVLLTLVVLIQNPKGGGIAANFVAPTQIMGAKRSTDVVEKATWVLALACWHRGWSPGSAFSGTAPCCKASTGSGFR